MEGKKTSCVGSLRGGAPCLCWGPLAPVSGVGLALVVELPGAGSGDTGPEQEQPAQTHLR